MADIYRSFYDNPAGDSFQVDIRKASGANTTIELVQAKATIARAGIDGPLVQIRPTTCSLELEASGLLTFDDLFTEIDKQWIIEVQRNSTTIFEGYLEPEGIFEDYVNEVWILEVTANDGLTELTNLSYVDSSGDNYQGITALGIILQRCLDRTGFVGRDLKFQQRSASNVNFPVQYVEVFPGTQYDFFIQTVDQAAFIDDDGAPKSCEEVLNQILAACNGVVFYEEDAWYINWALQHCNPGIDGLFKYSLYTGGAGFPSTVDENVNRTIYSQVNQPTPSDLIWIQEDQRIERRPSMAATRADYRYRNLSASNGNPELENNGAFISGWTINIPAEATLTAPSTITLEDGVSASATITSNPTAVQYEEGTTVKIQMTFGVQQTAKIASFGYRVVLDGDDANTYYMGADGTWTLSVRGLRIQTGATPVQNVQYAYTSQELPVGGTVQILILSMDNLNSDYATEMQLEFISIANALSQPDEGVTHTVERILNPSSYIEDAREVFLSDVRGVIRYNGSLLWQDEQTETTEGYTTPTSAFAFQLYQIMLTDRMRIRGKAVRLFQGSVYGYFPYNSRILIDNIPDKQFIVSAWSYDTGTGIIAGEYFEVVWDDADADNTEYTRQDNPGQVVEPKIRG